MMIILTAAAIAAAQPAPASQAPAGPPAGHGAGHAGHAGHGQMQHGENCPCCDHGGSSPDRDCCAEHAQHRGHDDRH
jgi:hypothetical protein